MQFQRSPEDEQVDQGVPGEGPDVREFIDFASGVLRMFETIDIEVFIIEEITQPG